LRHQFRLPIIASFLENHLLQIPERRSADPSRAIVAIATAYRRFALGNPALYALMFERRPPGFDLPPQLRSWALNLIFTRSSSGSCWTPCEPS
jgi:Tetracyclin repressor-like, C-terminal domain